MREPRSLIIGADGAAPLAVAALLDMLSYAREQTLLAVANLTVEQLDHRHDAESNSIASLLAHIAAVEAWYQTNTFENRDWTDAEEQQWAGAVDLGVGAPPDGHALDFYVKMLGDVREKTIAELRHRDEAWLLRVEPLGSTTANNYWKWFHVCEDEINHRGQIRWLRKRLPV